MEFRVDDKIFKINSFNDACNCYINTQKYESIGVVVVGNDHLHSSSELLCYIRPELEKLFGIAEED
jgi:hypothetical protein